MALNTIYNGIDSKVFEQEGKWSLGETRRNIWGHFIGKKFQALHAQRQAIKFQDEGWWVHSRDVL
jgi:hypothetical protein